MFLALKELKHSKLRYVLVIFIMTLIVWLVLFVSGLANGLAKENASAIEQDSATHFVVQDETENRLARSAITDKQLEEVKAEYGEKATPLQVNTATIVPKNSKQKTDVTYFGIDKKQFMAPVVTEGTPLKDLTGNEVVVDDKMKADNFKLGSRFTDERSGVVYTIKGFTTGQAYSHTPVVYMNGSAFDEMIPKTKHTIGKYSAIVLNITDKEAEKGNFKGLTIVTQKDIVENIPGYSAEQGSLTMMIVFLIVIATFVLAAFFYVITIQKMSQFGVLKALGATNAYLSRSLLSQILVLAIISIVISILLTLGVASILPAGMPFAMTPMMITGISAIFIVVSVLGSLLSLYRVFKVDPIEAIGGSN